jgi:uncharacterized membrane protein HdeD (DUF308 family)
MATKRQSFDPDILKNFSTIALVMGGLLLVLGAAGIFAPMVFSLVASVFFGWLMIIAGLAAGYYTYKGYKASFMGWLKPVLLVITGGMILINPVAGVAALALLLTFYLLMDAFSSFGLASALYPGGGWGWMVLNGLLSVVLAALLLAGWPETSPFLVGIYIGISLLFDGAALLAIGLATRKSE